MCKQPKCLSAGEWINKCDLSIQWSIIQPQKGKVWIHATAWMNPENMMESERSQTEKQPLSSWSWPGAIARPWRCS